MRCPFCGNEDTQVLDTRSSTEASSIRRRRKCPACDKRFTTDGSRTDFERDKLVGSMMLALRKRPVATDALEGAVARIEEKLRSLGEREVRTSRVGDMVMRELAKLDKIAYIRFASVYRSFESPDDFREAVQEVKTKKRRK
jgi:transcriptional repressor NrdR